MAVPHQLSVAATGCREPPGLEGEENACDETCSLWGPPEAASAQLTLFPRTWLEVSTVMLRMSLPSHERAATPRTPPKPEQKRTHWWTPLQETTEAPAELLIPHIRYTFNINILAQQLLISKDVSLTRHSTVRAWSSFANGAWQP
ncbi:UNVERIFIED_CONTAM: hypothetical protein K2H54_042412 [Gekko kuhli]